MVQHNNVHVHEVSGAEKKRAKKKLTMLYHERKGVKKYFTHYILHNLIYIICNLTPFYKYE